MMKVSATRTRIGSGHQSPEVSNAPKTIFLKFEMAKQRENCLRLFFTSLGKDFENCKLAANYYPVMFLILAFFESMLWLASIRDIWDAPDPVRSLKLRSSFKPRGSGRVQIQTLARFFLLTA